jgi:hypothetical protein
LMIAIYRLSVVRQIIAGLNILCVIS